MFQHVVDGELGAGLGERPEVFGIVSGLREGGPFSRDGFRKGPEAEIGPMSQRVLLFGPLAENSEWYLVLKDQASKDALLLAQNVSDKKQGKILFRSALRIKDSLP